MDNIDFIKSYKNYISYPLATITTYKFNELYKNKWCNFQYKSLICEPHRHSYFSFEEFIAKIKMREYKKMKDMFVVYKQFV